MDTPRESKRDSRMATAIFLHKSFVLAILSLFTPALFSTSAPSKFRDKGEGEIITLSSDASFGIFAV